MTEPDWADQPFQDKPFRFSKFYLNTLFDKRLHLVRRGTDFPAAWAVDDVAKRLRSAAWWRHTTIRISPCPEGLWVESADDVTNMEGTPDLRDQLARALDENARLKEHNTQLRSEVWQLKNQ